VLDQLGLTAYLFEVEPHEGAWEVRIDCGRLSDWQSTTLAVDGKRLLSSCTNEAVRAELLEEWGKHLAQYRYPGGASIRSPRYEKRSRTPRWVFDPRRCDNFLMLVPAVTGCNTTRPALL